MERYILVDKDNIVTGIVEGDTVFHLLDSGIPFYNAYQLNDVEPEIGQVYNP